MWVCELPYVNGAKDSYYVMFLCNTNSMFWLKTLKNEKKYIYIYWIKEIMYILNRNYAADDWFVSHLCKKVILSGTELQLFYMK